jgi:signal transduction histidine kinase
MIGLTTDGARRCPFAAKAAGLTVVFFLLLGSVCFSWKEISECCQSRRATVCHQYVLTELQTMLSTLDAVEAGKHAYLMFGNSELLYPTNKARFEIESSYTRLASLSALTDMEKHKLGKLHDKCSRWLNLQSNISRMTDAESLSRELQAQIAGEQARICFFSESFEMKTQNVLLSLSCLGFVALLALAASVSILLSWSKQQEKNRLQQTEQRVTHGIISGAPIGIARLDSNLNITEANAAFANQMSAEKKEQLLMRPLGEFISDKEIFASLREHLLVQSRSFSFEGIRLVIESGQPRHLNLTGWPLKDRENCVCGGVLLTNEVSERIRLLELRDDIFSTIAHDLKSPLIGMERVFDLLISGKFGDLNDDQATAIVKLKQCGSALVKCVKRLVEVHKYEDSPVLQFELFDLVSVIHESMNMLLPVAENKKLAIQLHFPARLEIMADNIAILRLVSNLLENAVKFTWERGAIDICLSRSEQSAILEFTNDCDPISPLVRERMFQRFFQGAPGQSYVASTGLGLYMCSKITELHSGSITCFQASDHSVTFRVILPLRPSEVAPEKRSAVRSWQAGLPAVHLGCGEQPARGPGTFGTESNAKAIKQCLQALPGTKNLRID